MITQQQCKLWIDKLRSGEYKQVQRALRDNRSCYCCLGVLADLLDSSAWSSNKLNSSWNWDGYIYYYKIPEVHLENSIQKILINLNDEENQNFNQIADHIEENIYPHCLVEAV